MPYKNDRYENAAIVAVLAIVTLLVVSAQLRADESADYYRARASAAIAIADVSAPNPPPKTPTISRLPVVYVTVAPFQCPPCEDVKAVAKTWPTDAPFTLSIGSDSHGLRVPHYPFVHWRNGEKWWHLGDGWNGTQDLIQRWKVTQTPTAAASNRWPAMRGYHGRWSYPGDLRSHLRESHGVTESLTQAQAEFVHDYIHEGGSVAILRARYH